MAYCRSCSRSSLGANDRSVCTPFSRIIFSMFRKKAMSPFGPIRAEQSCAFSERMVKACSRNAKKFFGVSLAAEKELIFILSAAETRKPIMKAIMAKAGIQSAAQSLVFSLPVGDIAGLRELEQPET